MHEASSPTTRRAGPDRADLPPPCRLSDAVAPVDGARSRKHGKGKSSQLKAGRELMGQRQCESREQLRANQEQLTRGVARLSEQLKTSQEQMLLDKATWPSKSRQSRSTRSRHFQASKQNAPPRIARLVTADSCVARKPVPALSSPQATAQRRPKNQNCHRPQRPPAPAR